MPDVGEAAQPFQIAPGFASLETGTVTSSKEHGDEVKKFLNEQDVPPLKNVCPFLVQTKRYILTALGYPNVEVELCDEHMEWAIVNTIDEFVRYNVGDFTRFWRIPTQTNQSRYELPEDLLVVRDIVTLKIAEFDTIFGTDILINPLYLRNSKEAYQDILTFWLSEAAFETWRRVYGLNLSWDIFEAGRLINIYPTPRETRFMVIKGTYRPDLATFDERALKTKVELFRRMALYHSMAVLGRIRGKRPGGITSSQGPVQLDGDTLRQEANTELKEIRAELIGTGKPLGFYTG